MPKVSRRRQPVETLSVSKPKAESTYEAPQRKVSKCAYLGLAASAVAAKVTGTLAAAAHLSYRYCPSSYLPLRIKDLFSADTNYIVRFRKYVSSLIVSPENVKALALTQSVILGPPIEEAQRASIHILVKKVQAALISRGFANTKTAAMMRIAISATVTALCHFECPLGWENRHHPNFLQYPELRAQVYSTYADQCALNDTKMIMAFFNAIVFATAYEMTQSIKYPLVLHSSMNLILQLTGLDKIKITA